MSFGAVMAGAAFIKLTLDDASLQKGLEHAHGKLKAFKFVCNPENQNKGNKT